MSVSEQGIGEYRCKFKQYSPEMQIFYKTIFCEAVNHLWKWGVCVQEEVYANKIREIDVVIVVALMWQRRTMHDADVSV